MTWVLLFLALAVLAALPIIAERRRSPITDSQRRTAPGGFAQLTDGLTHYRWYGNPDGPVYVLVHGLTTSSYVWEGLVGRLIVPGARVLIYDLFGRGLSDRPDGPQDPAFFVRQLRELLQEQGIEDDITLIGYSMGGAIATVFAAEEAERIERLILIAPSGLIYRSTPFGEFCRKVPYIGDGLMAILGGITLRRGLDPDLPSSVPNIAARQAAETRTQGFLPAVLSSMRHMVPVRLDKEHAEISRKKLPVMAVWGVDDQVIPIQAMGELVRLNRDARQVEIPGADHALVHTHPVEVNEAIQEFVRQTGGATTI